MRYLYTILLILFFIQLSKGQSKKDIDSVNQIKVHDIKIPLDELIVIFNKNVHDAEKLNYTEGKAKALAKLSTVYTYKGDSYDKATEAMLKSIRIYESIGNNSEVSKLYGDFGWLMKRRDLNGAIGYMQKGISIATKYGYETALKDLYNNYGILKQMNKEIDSAIYFFNKGLKIKQKQQDEFGIPYSLSNLSGAYLEKRDYNKAKDLLYQSITLREKLEDSVGIGENFVQLGEVNYAEGDYITGLKNFKASAAIAKIKDYKKLEMYAYEYISRIYQNQKQTDSALHYFQKYIDIKDQMFTETQEAKISELTIAFETEKKELALAQSKIEIQKKNLQLYSAIGGIILLVLIAYLIYKYLRTKNVKLKKEIQLKTALARIETQNKLEEQRLRISRDLHDNIGSQLTFVISSLQFIQFQKKLNADEIRSRVDKIGSFTQQTIHELRDTIWAMNKENIILSDLISRLTNFINQLNIKESMTVEVSASLKPKLDEIVFTALDGIHIYRIIQESINNAVKHAEANTIEVKFSNQDNLLIIFIKDDGKGFNVQHAKSSNGLKNIKKRAGKLNAEIHISSQENKGSMINLEVKI